MKILYIIPSLDSKAPVALAIKLAKHCLELGYEVTIYYFDNIQKIIPNCQFKKISMDEDINYNDFDVIHTHGIRPDMYIYKNRKKIITPLLISTVHCDIYTDLKYIYGPFRAYFFTKIWKLFLTAFDYTVQINDYLMDRNFLRSNVLIYNGIQLEDRNGEDYSDLENEIANLRKKNYKIIVSYCVIQKRKGLHQIIDVLKELPDFAFVCIGNGPELEVIRHQASINGVNDRIIFYPFIRAPYNILNLVDIFAIPSYSEGFSLALLEAGLFGTSVICSDIPSFNKPFNSNEVTFFILNDIESLKKGILEAYIRRLEKKENLKKKIINNYSQEKMFSNYVKLYNTAK